MPYLGRQPGVGVRNRYIYTATASQTTFSGADDNGATLAYDDGAYVDVYLNGVLLIPVTDYAATTKTSVVLTSGAAASDLLEILAYEISSIADTVSKANGGTFDGAVTVNNNFVVDNGTIKLDGNHPVGTGNVALGDTALDSLSTGGDYNTAIGFVALTANTTGSNTAVGASSAENTTTGTDNSSLGRATLYANTTGSNNVAVGRSALQSNTTASNLTAVGYQAGYSNTTGINLTAVGRQAAYSNTTGANNTALGLNALYANTTGASNVSIGLQSLDANTTGSSNTALGMDALGSNTTASNNTAVGYQALYANTTGTQNVAMGASALDANTTGTRNTVIGYNAMGANTASTANVAIGDHALLAKTSTGNDNVAIGTYAGSGLTTGSNSTFVGAGAGNTITTGDKNTILGRYNGNQGGLDIRTSSNNIVLSDGDGNPRIMYVTGDGFRLNALNSGAGNSTLKYNTSTGVVTYDTSSERFKQNIVDSPYGLSQVLQLQSRQYEFINDGKPDIGLIAEEVNNVIPELVGKDSEGNPMSVAYDRFVSVLIKAVQELSAKNDALEARITALEAP